MKTLPNLDTLLEYKNPHVIARYQREYPEKSAEAESLFTELLTPFGHLLPPTEGEGPLAKIF